MKTTSSSPAKIAGGFPDSSQTMQLLPALTLVVAFSVAPLFAAENPAGIPADYKLVYSQDFEKPDAIQEFTFSDPTAWKVTAGDKGQSLELTKQSKYETTVRSPFNIALITEKVVGDFILEADLIQTGKEYGHRDMCLFFGFTAPAKFYYTHIATKADSNAHNVLIVNEAPRKNFAKETTAGVNWGLNIWHKVRLERKGAVIKVYFDDLAKPIMLAEESTFAKGHVGFGSFDDTGKVDNIKLWAPAVEIRKIGPFPKPAKPAAK